MKYPIYRYNYYNIGCCGKIFYLEDIFNYCAIHSFQRFINSVQQATKGY